LISLSGSLISFWQFGHFAMVNAHLLGFSTEVFFYCPVAEMVVVKLKPSILSARGEMASVSCSGIAWFGFRV
jgi:hypothetical protein